MLLKNNKKLQTEKMEPKHQRFTIKKFTVGVASVLVGTTFAISMGTTLVSADETSAQVTEVLNDSVAEKTSEDEEGTLEKSTPETTEAISETELATVVETPQETPSETFEVKTDLTADQAHATEETSQIRTTAGATTEIQTEDQTSKASDQIKQESTFAFRSVSEATAEETTADAPAPRVEDVDLTKSKIEFNKPVLHVNQDIDEVNGLLTKEYVENSLIKKLTLSNGTVYEGEELRNLLNAVVAEYSWGDDPDVSVASDDVVARLRARLNNKRSVTWDMMISVIGAEAKTDTKTPWGVRVDAVTAIANVDELKQFDTTDTPVSYAWKTEPDFRPGVGADHNVTGVVVVTYPDGTTQDISVPIMVGDSQADTFATKDETTTIQKITVHYGQTVDPILGIVDPAGNNMVKANFDSPIDATIASDEKRSAVMTFTDGSSVPVDIPVEVIVATPKADVTTPWGQVPDAKSLIANTDVLTQFDQTDKPVAYTWKQEPDVRPVTGATERNATGIVTVTYPDGTTQDVEVTVVVDKSEADKFLEDQSVKTQTVTVKRGQTVASSTAFDGLTETTKTDLKATGATFNDQIDTSAAAKKDYPATVTFADGSTASVDIPVVVTEQAQEYDPVGKNIETGLNTLPTAGSAIDIAASALPEGTIYAWKQAPDVTTKGVKDAVVVVTYPDGSTDDVSVKVTVIAQNDEFMVAYPSTSVVEHDAVTLTPTITDKNGTVTTPPTGTKFTLKDTDQYIQIDENTGVITVINAPLDLSIPDVVVTYPDGTTTTLTPDLTVYQRPVAGEARFDLNGPVTAEKAKEAIKNSTDLPEGATYEWKTIPDTSNPGFSSNVVSVTYPNGTIKDVTVSVRVGTDAEINQPSGRNIQVDLNGTMPEASVATTNLEKLPEGTVVTWKDPVDTTTPGYKKGTVVVTYPDGTIDEMVLQVKVGTDAEIYDPTVQEIQTPINGDLKPEDGILNFYDMPSRATWKDPVDTTTPGHKEGTVILTYPDGTTDEVVVPIKVGTDAQIYEPQVKEIQVDLNGIPEATAGIENMSDLPVGTTVAWKEPVDTTTPGHKEGTVVVTYPDGTAEEVTVPVKVGTDEQIYEPQAKEVQVELNGTPEATAGIENMSDLPTGTTVSWKEPIDTTTPGTKEGTVVVIYPDGTTEEVTVPVKVGTDTEIYIPTGQEVKTSIGEDPDAKAGISNLA
ncbi:Rib/alpha-like domain-containing protein, partial [uncultured Ligilactobacillus sp.]|uniref:Rib/alpha-like domain-containing protein n=1 Tax=uncultured Ligilactobacillus sp. TaxID=2837633 RepID=UPI00272AE1BA